MDSKGFTYLTILAIPNKNVLTVDDIAAGSMEKINNIMDSKIKQ